MSLHSFEKDIWAELKVVETNPKIRFKDIMEWSTGTIVADAELDEKLVHLPIIGVNVVYVGAK